MDAREFLDNFEHISSAPNGVQRLRELILQLAVQGRLVGQAESDEPVAVLIGLMEEEKVRLLRERKIKKPKSLAVIRSHEKPFKIPTSWEWLRLGQTVNQIAGGGTPSKSNPTYWNGAIPWASVKDLKGRYINETIDTITENGLKNSSASFVPKSNVIVCTRMGLGKVAINRIDLAINQDLKMLWLSGHIDIEYFVYAYQTFEIKGKGTTVRGIRQDQLRNFLIPIPPRQEQKRIANKVNELMTFCDQLEAQQKHLTETRQKANQAALDALSNAATKEEITKCWLRIQDSFNDLNQSTEAIENLKKTIVQLSLQGRLIEATSVGPGVDGLLEKIDKERNELIKQKVVKRQRPLSPMTSEPFSLPSGAIWCRLSELFIVVTDGDHQPPPKTTAGIPFLVIGNVRNGYLDFSDTRHVPEAYYQSLDETRKPRKGDLLYTVVGSYGIPVHITTEKEFCVQRHIAILKPSKHMDVEYLFYVLQSRLVFGQATEVATGIAQKTVPLGGLRNILIPLYPIDQQKIIAGRIRRYSQLCDQLAGHLTQRESVHERLTSAAVYSVATKQPEMVLTVMDSKVSVAAKGEISIKQWRKIPSVLIELVETMKKKVTDTVLAKLLKEHNQSMEARELWQKSGLTIDEFYAILKREITEGFIAEPEVARLKLAEVID